MLNNLDVSHREHVGLTGLTTVSTSLLLKVIKLYRWCSGRASASSAENYGFDPRPGHTKYSEIAVNADVIGVQGCGDSAKNHLIHNTLLIGSYMYRNRYK